MLRLVHPAPAGNATDPPKRKRGPAPALSLTAEEARHLRVATRNIARTHGSLRRLAAVLGVQPGTLSRTARLPSAGLAVALARVHGLSIDALLSGKLVQAGSCPTCGAKPAAQAECAGGAR
jgi:hypothetical protein